MPPAKVITKKVGKKAKKVVPARLSKGIKGTEDDPALQDPTYMEIVPQRPLPRLFSLD